MSDLVKSLIDGLSTKETIEEAKRLTEEKLEKKRQEMAGAITRLVINDALRDMRARKKIFDETKGQGETEA